MKYSTRGYDIVKNVSKFLLIVPKIILTTIDRSTLDSWTSLKSHHVIRYVFVLIAFHFLLLDILLVLVFSFSPKPKQHQILDL